MIEITIAPSAAWINRPRPPKRLTPPTTAAATPLRTMVLPAAAELPFEALIDATTSYLLAAG